jgi:succinate dehydrogenase / fumarate reductase flavoprotein subunit
MLDAKIPQGALSEKWTKYKGSVKLVNPANKRKLEIIVVGTGLAGSSAAASLGEMGYKVKAFCFQDSPRRAHSIAAQGGINAAKNYQNDGDSTYRLFYDTIKGGDYSAGIWRFIEQPFIWWNTGTKNFLCCRTNWSAIIDRCLSGFGTPGCIGHGSDVCQT